MLEKPIFYSFRRCPYAIRARLALSSAGVEVEHREIELKNKPAHMLEHSPKGTVPVLIKKDGSVLDESIDIMRWALEQDDPECLNACSVSEIALEAELIEQNDGQFKASLDRYKYSVRFPERSREEYFLEASSHLQDLNQRLSVSTFILGNELKFVDLALFPFVRQFRNSDVNRFNQEDWPNLQRWVDYLRESNRFKMVMSKYRPWLEHQISEQL